MREKHAPTHSFIQTRDIQKKSEDMTQLLGMIDQEDWGTLHCEEGYDKFGCGQAELEKLVEFSCLLLCIFEIQTLY